MGLAGGEKQIQLLTKSLGVLYMKVKQNEEEIKLAKPKVHKNSAGYYVWNVIQNNIFDFLAY